MANYTGNNPHYKAAGWTEIRNAVVKRETDKSWQVVLRNGQEPFVPKSQFQMMTNSALMKVGNTVDIKVKSWLVEKWESAAKKQSPVTFEFNPQDAAAHELLKAEPGKSKEPDDSFLFDYSKKQLVAACAAYRSVLQQVQVTLQGYRPTLSTTLARDNKVLDGRAGAPDEFGQYPTIVQKWNNPEPIKEGSKQIAAVLKSIYVGQATLEKMAQIESLLGEKRAEVAAELLRSMDDDEE